MIDINHPVNAQRTQLFLSLSLNRSLGVINYKQLLSVFMDVTNFNRGEHKTNNYNNQLWFIGCSILKNQSVKSWRTILPNRAHLNKTKWPKTTPRERERERNVFETIFLIINAIWWYCCSCAVQEESSTQLCFASLFRVFVCSFVCFAYSRSHSRRVCMCECCNTKCQLSPDSLSEYM